MRVAPTLAAVALVAGTVTVTGSAASADLVTNCVGQGGAVTVPGDLVVPAGKSCTLTGTTVNGDVRLMRGSDLVVLDGTIDGGVVLYRDAYFDATGTTVGEGIYSNGGYGTYLEDSMVGRGYTEVGSDAVPFLFTTDVSIGGWVQLTKAAAVFDTTDLRGHVTSKDGEYTDIFNSTLFRNLTIEGNAAGSVICESEIDGDAVVSGNSYGVQIGGGGWLSECEGPTYFGGDLTVSNNHGGVQVSETIIRGDLGGEGNEPAPTGSDNRVRGDVWGQFEDLQPTPEESSMAMRAQSSEGESTEADHKAKLKADSEQRRAAAAAEAAAAGKAQL